MVSEMWSGVSVSGWPTLRPIASRTAFSATSFVPAIAIDRTIGALCWVPGGRSCASRAIGAISHSHVPAGTSAAAAVARRVLRRALARQGLSISADCDEGQPEKVPGVVIVEAEQADLRRLLREADDQIEMIRVAQFRAVGRRGADRRPRMRMVEAGHLQPALPGLAP